MRNAKFLVFSCLLSLSLLAGAALAQDCLELQGQARFQASGEGRDYLAATTADGGWILGLTSDAQLIVLQQDPTGVPAEVHAAALEAGDGWLAAIGQTVYVSGEQGVKIFQIQGDGSLLAQGYLPGQEVAAEIKASGDMLAVIHDGAWSLWDCAVPASPVLLSRTEFINSASSLNEAHLGLGQQYAVVNELAYDLSDPAIPQAMPAIPLGYGVIEGQEVFGSTLYRFIGYYADGGSWIYGDRWFSRDYSVLALDLDDGGNYQTLAAHTFEHSSAIPPSAPHVVMGLSGGHILAGQTHDANLLVIDTSLAPDSDAYRVPVLPDEVMVYQDAQLLGLGTETFAVAMPATMDTGTVDMPAVGIGSSYPGGGYTYYSLFDTDARDDLLVVAVGESDSEGQHYYDEFTNLSLYRMTDGALETLFTEQLYDQWPQVALGTNHLFLCAYALRARDISDPTSPGESFVVPDVDPPYGLAALGGDLFAIGNNFGEISIWDLADPSAPELRGSCSLGERATEFFLEGDALLASMSGSANIKVLDVSDPANPRVAQTVELPARPKTLVAREGRAVAVVVEDGRDVQVTFDYSIDVVPQVARAVFTSAIPTNLNSAVYLGSQVFLGGNGLHEFDPAVGSYVGCMATSHPYLGLVAMGEHLYGVAADELVDVTEIVCGDQGISGVDPATPALWASLQLTAAPNPFNPRTSFQFKLQRNARATLVVHDIKGRVVRHLLDEERPAGLNEVPWDGRGDGGQNLASGMYFGRLQTPEGAAVTRVVLIK